MEHDVIVPGSEEFEASTNADKALKAALAEGLLAEGRADYARAAYSNLHDTLKDALSRETELLHEAKRLKQALEAESLATLPAASNLDADASHDVVAVFREDLESAAAEVAVALERQQLLQLEVTELQRHRNEISSRVSVIKDEKMAALQPLINTLTGELEALQQEVTELNARHAKEAGAITQGHAQLEGLARAVQGLRQTLEEEQGNHQKAVALPEKVQRQNDILIAAIRGLQGQLDSMGGRTAELDGALKQMQVRCKQLSDEEEKLRAAVERAHIMTEGKDRHADAVNRDLQLAAVEQERVLADAVDLDLRLRGVAADVKGQQEGLARRVKDKDGALRRYKAAEVALKQVQDSLGPLRNAKANLQRDRAVLEGEGRRAEAGVGEVRKEVDLYMSAFLKEESTGEHNAGVFRRGYEQVGVLEAEVRELRAAEGSRVALVNSLSSARDRLARMVSSKAAKMREAQAAETIRNVEVADLKKAHREVGARIGDFEKLYTLVKNQRNKFVHLLQAAGQSAMELKEKVKILVNELEILRGESGSKDKALGGARGTHAVAVGDRDALRSDVNRLMTQFAEKQLLLEEQIAQVDKLNMILGTEERNMLRLKKQYETAIEARNSTGIMLIDRNDELCILYEKANTMEQVNAQGRVALLRRGDEVRVLGLEVATLERSLVATRQLLPLIPQLDVDTALLQKQLLEARREAHELSAALEDPGNSSRWRMLGGKIPEPAELVAKIQALEERLTEKKEALLEKELIMQEVGQLSDRLRAQAGDGRGESLELAKKANQYQQLLRGAQRKMMGTVSELSLMQAIAMKLSAERGVLEQQVGVARQLLADGAPPTEEAEREWQYLQHEKAVLAATAAVRREVEAERMNRATGTVSTADPRPNAYIPEQLGIPKPYGGFAPFKPQEPGSTMRHIRRPEPREVVL